MAFKTFVVLCAQIVLAKNAFSQCFGRGAGMATNGLIGNNLMGTGFGLAGNALAANGLAANSLATNNLAANSLSLNGLGWGTGIGAGVAVPSNGGALPISSTSSIVPSGLSIISENFIDGPLAVTGSLPFLGAIAMDGVLPTAGSGAIAYGCGNGNIGIESIIGGSANGESVANNVGHANGVGLANGMGFGNGVGLGNVVGLANGIGYGSAGLGLGAGVGRRGCGCGRVY